MRSPLKIMNFIADTATSALQGASAFTQLSPDQLDRVDTAERAAAFNANVAHNISTLLEKLLFIALIVESARAFMNIGNIFYRWFYLKEKISIETISRLVWSALRISLLICALLVSLPIFLMVFSASNLLENCFMLFCYLKENSTMSDATKKYLNSRSLKGVWNYAINAVASALLLTASILFFVGPAAFIVVVGAISITAFALVAIKFIISQVFNSDEYVKKPSADERVTQYLDVTFTHQMIIADDSNLFTIHSLQSPRNANTISSMADKLKVFFSYMSSKLSTHQTSDTPLQSHLKALETLFTKATAAAESKNDGTYQVSHTGAAQWFTEIQTELKKIRKEFSSLPQWGGLNKNSFFRSQERRLFPDVVHMIGEYATSVYKVAQQKHATETTQANKLAAEAEKLSSAFR